MKNTLTKSIDNTLNFNPYLFKSNKNDNTKIRIYNQNDGIGKYKIYIEDSITNQEIYDNMHAKNKSHFANTILNYIITPTLASLTIAAVISIISKKSLELTFPDMNFYTKIPIILFIIALTIAIPAIVSYLLLSDPDKSINGITYTEFIKLFKERNIKEKLALKITENVWNGLLSINHSIQSALKLYDVEEIISYNLNLKNRILTLEVINKHRTIYGKTENIELDISDALIVKSKTSTNLKALKSDNDIIQLKLFNNKIILEIPEETEDTIYTYKAINIKALNIK